MPPAPVHKARKDYTGKTNKTVAKVSFVKKRRPGRTRPESYRRNNDLSLRRK